MDMKIADARGLSCPEPVIMAKKLLEKNKEGGVILVDNQVSKENVKRFAENLGFKVSVTEKNGEFTLDVKAKK